jgi:hypothetical protein
VFDHRRRNKESGVFEPWLALKRDADGAVILNYRSAAIARINGSIRLDREELSIANVGVWLELNARDNAACVRNFFAARRIAVGDDSGSHFRQFAEFERFEVFEEVRVLYGQKRQVTIVGDKLDFGKVGVRILVTVNDDLSRPTHDMGIRHDAFALDHESGAARPMNRFKSPWSIPHRLLDEGGDLDDRTLGLSANAREPCENQRHQTRNTQHATRNRRYVERRGQEQKQFHAAILGSGFSGL